ncbi:hypothetical protein Tco_0219527, partial [Tanacetum coccineum]
MSSKGIDLHTEECHHVIKSVDGSFSLKNNKGTTKGFSHVMFGTRRKPNTKVCQKTSDPNKLMFCKRMSAEDLVPETYKMSQLFIDYAR